ncbi:MAG: ankyrin repeat domain-containing protein [Phycisphaerales bacterium]|nr:MAG: ankyrin repeat domain-containing protein [Phycisphaerales bacterium]
MAKKHHEPTQGEREIVHVVWAHRPYEAKVAWGGSASVSVLLLASVALLAFTGCTSIQTAARRGDRKAVERQLALGVNVNSHHFWTSETALIEAAAHGHRDIVQLLIDRGADVNMKGEAWYGPLHAASAGGYVEIVELLLDHGADVSIFHHDKPLHYAAKNGHITIAEMLLARGADVNAKGIDEFTPLGSAVASRQREMADYLLSQGADVNARASYSCTALFTCYANDDVETGRLLVRHGADVTLECNGRKIPLSFLERLRR